MAGEHAGWQGEERHHFEGKGRHRLSSLGCFAAIAESAATGAYLSGRHVPESGSWEALNGAAPNYSGLRAPR